MTKKLVLLFIAIALSLPAAAFQKPPKLSVKKGDKPGGASMRMTVGMARVLVRELLYKRHLPNIKGRFLIPGSTLFETKNVRLDRDQLAFDYEATEGNKRVQINYEIPFKKTDYLKYYANDRGLILCHDSTDRFYFVFLPAYSVAAGCGMTWKEERDVQRFTDAVNRLIYESNVGSASSNDMLVFSTNARRWRENPESRPSPPVGWERYRILAEQSVSESDLLGALEHYEAGLEVHPLWAEGWFNAALLYEALKEYESAAHRMKHYLELAPDAPDAAAAREKVIIWEDKARRR